MNAETSAAGLAAYLRNEEERFAIRLEEVTFMLDQGRSLDEVCQMLNVSPGALARQLYRRGHNELARPFESLHKRVRRKSRAKAAS